MPQLLTANRFVWFCAQAMQCSCLRYIVCMMVVLLLHARSQCARESFRLHLIAAVCLQIAQLLTVRRQQEIEQGVSRKRESR